MFLTAADSSELCSMEFQVKSLRTFLGSVDFATSQSFYTDLGFTERVISPGFSVFQRDGLSFYLQDHNVKDWLENLMLFIEVADVEACYKWIEKLDLSSKYPTVSLMAIEKEEWGAMFNLKDPAGILLQFGQFY